jgi:hypothetical protein
LRGDDLILLGEGGRNVRSYQQQDRMSCSAQDTACSTVSVAPFARPHSRTDGRQRAAEQRHELAPWHVPLLFAVAALQPTTGGGRNQREGQSSSQA